MHYKLLRTLLILPLILNSNKPINKVASTIPISISGSVSFTELYEPIRVNLQMDEGHSYAAIYVYIYVNGVQEVFEETITKYLYTREYYISSFTKPQELKDIKVAVNYVEENVPYSECSFSIVAPTYRTVTNKNRNEYEYIETTSVLTEFAMKGSTVTKLEHTKEKIYMKGKVLKDLSENRFLDFSDLSFKLENSGNQEIKECELRIYTKFDKSDLLYKNNYTSIDLEMKKIDDTYYINNEYRFYIHKDTGMIYENYNEYCEDETLPFFFPLSMGTNQRITIEFHLHDVGYSHNEYVYKSYVSISSNKQIESPNFGHVLNYKYEEIPVLLKGVEYA